MPKGFRAVKISWEEGGLTLFCWHFTVCHALETVPYVHPQDGHPSVGDSVSQNQWEEGGLTQQTRISSLWYFPYTQIRAVAHVITCAPRFEHIQVSMGNMYSRVSIYKIWGNGIFGRYPIISNLLVTEIVLLNPLTHQPINHILQNDCRRN